MQWKITPGLTPYADALVRMDAHVAAMRAGQAGELVWLLEHPPLYTTGTSAKAADVLGGQFPVFSSGRGGQVTYHGPGQRVAYVMLDLNKRGRDVRAYVQKLEAWIIATLAQLGVVGFTREGRIGVWVEESPVASRQSPEEKVVRVGLGSMPMSAATNEAKARSADLASHEPPKARVGLGSMPTSAAANEAKIAALGVRVQGWVTSHGIAINVNPDLSHYAGIVPCGIREFGVTSLAALGVASGMDAVDAALKEQFTQLFPESIA